MTAPAMTAADINAALKLLFPQIEEMGETLTVEDVAPNFARLRLGFSEYHVRPGGTMSGPAMFTVADVSVYVAIFATLGAKAAAVTSNMNITFLRKPAPGDLIAECRLIKVGKRLAVGDVSIFAGDDPEQVAHATGSYSLPPSG